jgi:hypothetical protein
VSVWFVIPSKRPLPEAEACLNAWSERGYRVAVAREFADGLLNMRHVHVFVSSYCGWARSVNLLVNVVLARHPDVEWLVTGGDDYYPDPNHTADEIARECSDHFRNVNIERTGETIEVHPTFGVMQPTGDRWMDRGDGQGAVIDRVAGSPWMGREFCRRMYHGSGPLYNGYFHNFADEELQNVAQKLGVFWQRRDLMQEHRHWARPRGDWRDAPEWARKINDPALSDWEKSKALFAARKAAGFPGHDPLEL